MGQAKMQVYRGTQDYIDKHCGCWVEGGGKAMADRGFAPEEDSCLTTTLGPFLGRRCGLKPENIDSGDGRYSVSFIHIQVCVCVYVCVCVCVCVCIHIDI